MGFAPEQVRRMSFWEFAMLWEGYEEANSVSKTDAPTESDMDDQIERLM